jgi:hypothetical protein
LAVPRQALRAVPAQDRGNPLAVPVGAHEAILARASFDQPERRTFRAMAVHLDLDTVLVGPGEIQRHVGAGAASREEVARDRLSLLGSVRALLNPDLPADMSMGPSSDVTHGVDGRRGAAHRIADQAVAQVETGPAQPVRRGHGTDSRHDQISGHPGTVGQDKAPNVAPVDDRLSYSRIHSEVDAVVAVQVRDQTAHLLAELEGDGFGYKIHQGYRPAHLPDGRRDLCAEEAGSNHDDALGLEHRRAERERVVDRPDDVNAAQPVQHREPPGTKAGRDHDGVAFDGCAVVEFDLAQSRAKPGGFRSDSQIHLQGRDLGLAPQARAVRRPLPAENLLGKGRPVIGEVDFVSDQRDHAVEAVTAKGFRSGQPADRGAHDRDAPRSAHSVASQIATAGQRIMASSTAVRSVSGGSESSTRTTPSSRWSNTFGAASTHWPAMVHLSSSISIRIEGPFPSPPEAGCDTAGIARQ